MVIVGAGLAGLTVAETLRAEGYEGPVTLIGDELDVDAVAARCGTIGYETLTSLGRRHARRYVGAA